MAAAVPENWASFAGDDEFISNNVDGDFSGVDSALLMSILDDTQGVVGEDYDDERLRSVIQSLEAEIDGRTAVVDDYDFFTDSHHHQSSFHDSDDNFKNNQHFWEPSALDDLKLMDMEIEMEIESSFSIPNEGVVVNSWFADYPNCEHRSTIMDGMVEDGYGYLWEETMPQH